MPKTIRTHGPAPRGKRAKSKYLQLKKTACKSEKDPILRGEALAAIRADHLYRFEHANFEQFCRAKCGISRSHANRFIKASRIWHQRVCFPELPRHNVELLCRLSSVKDGSNRAGKLRQRVWQRTLEISKEKRTKPNLALLDMAITQVMRRSRTRRIKLARSKDLELISRFFEESPAKFPPLSQKQLRLATHVGLETLEALLGAKDEEAAALIKKLRAILRRLWPSTPPS